ncbi:AraC family transcriptional regulator [Candidatus Aminicenantes bacterium AH-873-B07]|nr:AraC family transcriptional regulator [Candidatus Aminicenantes bacterium AH-873-B07]
MDKRIKHILKFIEKKLDKNLDLRKIANYFNLSYFHLSKLFKQKLGKSFTEYLQKLRIKKAKILLKRVLYP